MPGKWPPEHAGCSWWLVMVLLLIVVLQRLKTKMDGGMLGPFPKNKLAFSDRSSAARFVVSSCRRGAGLETMLQQGSRIWSGSEGDQAELQILGSANSTLEEDFEPNVPEIAVGGAYQRWQILGSYAAHGGGRRAVSSGDYAAHSYGRLAVFRAPSLLLVEWRPLYFLPDSEPDGRQRFFLTASVVFLHGSLVVPSGVVPGGGEVLVREQPWTRLLSPSIFRGPLSKRQGPCCYFLFPLDLY